MSFKFAAATCAATMGIALTVGALADPSAAASPAAAPVQAAPVPKIDPQADQLLNKTCEALKSADAYSFHAEIMFDQVLPHQVKVQYAAEMNFALQRPDSLMVDYHSDLGGKSAPRDTVTKIEAKWLGACKPDQKPGDIIMPGGGFKLNVKDAAKLQNLLGGK